MQRYQIPKFYPIEFQRDLTKHTMTWTFKSEHDADVFVRWVMDNYGKDTENA